jgi:hypothetical protein
VAYRDFIASSGVCKVLILPVLNTKIFNLSSYVQFDKKNLLMVAKPVGRIGDFIHWKNMYKCSFMVLFIVIIVITSLIHIL